MQLPPPRKVSKSGKAVNSMVASFGRARRSSSCLGWTHVFKCLLASFPVVAEKFLLDKKVPSKQADAVLPVPGNSKRHHVGK
jgi:hypothetical protein